MEEKYESLKIKNQLCFPLYSAANKIVRSYTPLLKELELTYTQYLVMMVLWEVERTNEKDLGDTLFLKSNTLAPLLKKLKAKGYIEMEKDDNDARNTIISLSLEGEQLKEKAVNVPSNIAKCVNLTSEEANFLYKILYKYLYN